MEYVYAALILNESGAEINEQNLTNVLDSAGVSVEESRVKALIAALEDVNIDEAVEEAAAVPAPTGGGGGGAAPAPADASGDDDDEGEPEETEEAPAEDEGDDDEDEDAGEGLGELFG